MPLNRRYRIQFLALACTMIVLLVGCSRSNKNHLLNEFDIMKEGDKGAVLLFWAAECPLCLNYYKDMVEMSREYSVKGIPFYFVFTGADAKREEVESFLLNFTEVN